MLTFSLGWYYEQIAAQDLERWIPVFFPVHGPKNKVLVRSYFRSMFLTHLFSDDSV